jgi:hypothetical protein
MQYYFHIHVIDGESHEDTTGMDLPSDARAIAEARNYVRDVTVEAAETSTPLKWAVEVTNEAGKTIVKLDGEVKKAS